MKIRIYIFVLLFTLFASCSKETVSPTGIRYQQSLNNWIAYKASVNNNYSYTVTTSSWVGYSTATKITVRGGKVTARDYIATGRINNGPIETYKTWTETATNLNTHGSEGGDLITLDDIYAKAKSDWLTVDKKQNTIYFETDDKGLIASCGYVPENCADDCFRGVTIEKIAGL